MLSFIENILTGVKMWTDEHKQNKLTAGDNIKINGDTISAVNDNSWREIKVNDHTFLSSATTSGSLTLSAGTNVVLTDSNGVVTINSQGGGGVTTYSAGNNINIDNTNHIISAIGYTFNNTTLSFSESVGNTASGSYAHAEGYNTNAVGGASHAEGRYTYAYGGGSHAEGVSVIVGNAHDVVNNVPQYAYGSHGEGLDVAAVGMRSHAEGQGVASVGSTSHAEGGGVEGIDYWKKFTTGSTLTVTSGSTGATINKLDVLLLSSSTSETVSKLSIGDIIIYEGTSVAITDMLFDFDSTTLVFNRPWHNKTFSNVDISTINNGEDIKFFVFRSSVSLGAYSHIEGEHNIAYGRDSHAEGNRTKASGNYSHAEGCNTQAGTIDFYNTGLYPLGGTYNSFAVKNNVTNKLAVGDNIRIGKSGDTLTITNVVYTQYTSIRTDGPETQIKDTSQAIYKMPNECSHAEGSGTTAIGYASHAEGNRTKASGVTSHAEGSRTTASGNYSHAEGSGTIASGLTSHAEGSGTTASGNYSHAGGLGTIANKEQMTAIGKYNKEGVDGTLFAVGNGVNSANTSNAFTVNSGGSFTATATVNGITDVYLGCPIGTSLMWMGTSESVPKGWLLCDGYGVRIKITNEYYTGKTIKKYCWIRSGSTAPVCTGQMVDVATYADNFSDYIDLIGVIGDYYTYENWFTINGVRYYYGISDNYIGNTASKSTIAEIFNNNEVNINLPNLQQRFPLGASTSGNIGKTGGTSAVTLTSAQSGLREHTHSVNFVDQEMYKSNTSQNRVASGSTAVYNPQHEPTGWQWTRNNSAGVLNGVWDLYENNEDGQGRASRHIIETSKSLNATESHNNMPPYLTVNYIIKYK